MKRTIALLMLILLCLTAVPGCGLPVFAGETTAPTAAPGSAAATETAGPAPDPTPVEQPTPEPTAEPTPEPTPVCPLPPEARAYFERVGFSAPAGGAPAVSRWTRPIRIRVEGKPNEGDRKALSALNEGLAAVAGLPEILYVTEGGDIVIGFVPQGKGRGVLPGYAGEGAEGSAVWNGGAAEVRIVIPDELADQAKRDGSLAFFLFNGLGLGADREGEYADSVLNRDGNAAVPSAMDWLMLRLLYCNGLTPGMPPDQAMAVVSAFDPEAAAVPPGSANDPGISRDEARAYFNEVGFFWSGSARDGIVSKWGEPVLLQVAGSPTAEQQQLLDTYLSRIGEVAGFPGFRQVSSGGTFVISFQTAAQLSKEYPKMTDAEACALSISRNAKTGRITKCALGVATDFPDGAASRCQFLRLLMQALGFGHTSGTYPDSIFNYAATVQDWALLDWKMVEALYRADIKAGEKRAAVMKRLMAE